MGKKLFSLLLCFCACAGLALAQNMTVSGTVTSAEDGMPVIGASVFVQGTTNGVITDASGNYTLRNVPAGGTLVFSCIGFVNATRSAAQTVNVVLAPDSELLDQVVVTAQGLTRKQKAIGYSAQTMSQEQLTTTHNASLGNSLAGKVAGAQFWGQAGSTFNEGRIILRGPTSYNSRASTSLRDLPLPLCMVHVVLTVLSSSPPRKPRRAHLGLSSPTPPPLRSSTITSSSRNFMVVVHCHPLLRLRPPAILPRTGTTPRQSSPRMT